MLLSRTTRGLVRKREHLASGGRARPRRPLPAGGAGGVRCLGGGAACGPFCPMCRGSVFSRPAAVAREGSRRPSSAAVTVTPRGGALAGAARGPDGAPAPEETFHRKPLPEHLASFASVRGRALFGEALAGGGLKAYFPLAENFNTQSEPAFCGVSTLSMSLNALGVDPGRRWKGVWRWYDDAMLECCVPLSQFADEGMSFDQFASLAGCNGASVVSTRAEASSLTAFRAKVRACCVRDGGGAGCGEDAGPLKTVLVASYNRAVLGQTGEGHFSPVAAYAEASDEVLILDVARFKYPPHWVPVEDLWAAMADVNPWNDQSRGFFEIAPRPAPTADRGKHCRNPGA